MRKHEWWITPEKTPTSNQRKAHWKHRETGCCLPRLAAVFKSGKLRGVWSNGNPYKPSKGVGNCRHPGTSAFQRFHLRKVSCAGDSDENAHGGPRWEVVGREEGSTGLSIGSDVLDAHGAAPCRGRRTNHIATQNLPGPGKRFSNRSQSERTYVLLFHLITLKPSKTEQ